MLHFEARELVKIGLDRNSIADVDPTWIARSICLYFDEAKHLLLPRRLLPPRPRTRRGRTRSFSRVPAIFLSAFSFEGERKREGERERERRGPLSRRTETRRTIRYTSSCEERERAWTRSRPGVKFTPKSGNMKLRSRARISSAKRVGTFEIPPRLLSRCIFQRSRFLPEYALGVARAHLAPPLPHPHSPIPLALFLSYSSPTVFPLTGYRPPNNTLLPPSPSLSAYSGIRLIS